jgi:L-threonylcarbamoyladenylate synthase
MTVAGTCIPQESVYPLLVYVQSKAFACPFECPNVTPTILVDSDCPDRATLAAAAAVIRRGGLVAFPTETVYGLGANALDAAAVRKIFAAKGRPAINPIIVHVSDLEMARGLVANWPATAEILAGHFWPGPLTLVLPKSDFVPDVVTAGGPTVAIRMPAHPIALGLIRASGVPLAAPSANRSSELSPTRAEHVKAALDDRIDLILDGGPTPNGIESTVLDLTTSPATLLRPGPISVAALERVIGPIQTRRSESAAGALPSPGLLPRHYSPRTRVELFSDRLSLVKRSKEVEQAGERSAMVFFGNGDTARPDSVEMPTNAEQYAARFYDTLHLLDGRNCSRILIELPPDTPEWLAVHDRLTRAAAM